MITESLTLPKREKAVAFIVARLTSSRLRGKQMRYIGDKTILDWVVWHLKQCKQIDEIVIATVAEPENRPLIEFAKTRGIQCYWYEGEVEHVTTRLRTAAEVFNADICLLISADCPLLHAPALDDLVGEIRSSIELDQIDIKPNLEGEPAMMQGVIVARKKAWQRADDLSDTPDLKEHQFPIIYRRPELFNRKGIVLNQDIYSVPRRLSVDTPADLRFQTALYNKLIECGKDYTLPNALKLLVDEPEIVQINAHVHQRGFGEAAHRILFVNDLDSLIDNNILLANDIVEQLGWPVIFCLDSIHVLQRIKQTGMLWLWGAFGRKNNLCEQGSPPVNFSTAGDDFDLIILSSEQSQGDVLLSLENMHLEVPFIQLCYNKDTASGCIMRIYHFELTNKQMEVDTYELTSDQNIIDQVAKIVSY